MEDGSEGLRHWEKSHCFFRNADWEAAFARALAIGRERKGSHGEDTQYVETRLAAVVTLYCLGADPSVLAGESVTIMPADPVSFDPVFRPEEVMPSASFDDSFSVGPASRRTIYPQGGPNQSIKMSQLELTEADHLKVRFVSCNYRTPADRRRCLRSGAPRWWTRNRYRSRAMQWQRPNLSSFNILRQRQSERRGEFGGDICKTSGLDVKIEGRRLSAELQCGRGFAELPGAKQGAGGWPLGGARFCGGIRANPDITDGRWIFVGKSIWRDDAQSIWVKSSYPLTRRGMSGWKGWLPRFR